MSERSWNHESQGNLVYQGRSEHDVQYVVLHYLVSGGHLAGIDNRAQTLDLVMWEDMKILPTVQYDPQQPIDSRFA
ncbi:hypothetical protein TNCV_3025951 [Trichonephila clavipes]|nr:hypothetical protein TNCV_3025951 [Trichonephila clavipes]